MIEILGVEGEWLDKNKLHVDESLILIKDLEKPLTIHKRFDLALCLEVVEHLSESSADVIVDTLTGLSDIIIFSAAIPGQKGQNHINEQYIEYWEKKFKKKDYLIYDELREIFWNNPNIDVWYKQNIFIVMKKGVNRFGFKENQKIKTKIHPDFNTSYIYVVKKFFAKQIPFGLLIQMFTYRFLYLNKKLLKNILKNH